ncbi:uncharacterized protein LOC128890381 [Hylaeus anthracinus]|uniref:uncharacterized protein LOC128890381 n=1 Tax=Hylaeus anthracinus TaxID=313031 RepID=UPI0023B8DDAA|nr:uncharacterized protein LOC128890381 [Hylaeus anthracinus]
MTVGNAKKIIDPLILNERILSLIGVWPQYHDHMMFRISVVYYGLFLIMEYWDFVDCMGNLEMAVMNVLETFVTTTMYMELFLIARCRKQLNGVVVGMRRDIADETCFENEEEKRLYFNYNILSRRINKYSALLTILNIVVMYVRPVLHLATSFHRDNSTITYQLPFRVHLIFDYNTPRLYALMYLYQLPVTYIPMYHIAEIGLIVNTVLHLCAKLSILSYRIRNIQPKPSERFKDNIRRAVVMHLELTRLSKTLNDSFRAILLIELISRGFRLGLVLYVVLIKFSTDPAMAYNFLLQAAILIAFLYLYSYIGEQLIYESQRVGDAFYYISWPEVTSPDKKILLICLTNGQRKMYIMAGKFYTFSLFGFTGIMNTSLASFSMLRTRM